MSAGTVARDALPRRAWVEKVMGMPVSIHLRGDDVSSARAGSAVAAAYDVFRRMDGIFSTYRADSDVLRLRRGELALEHCDPLVTEALAIGEEATRRTAGAFTTLLPTGEGDVAFDPTGLVKGWAVERAALPLRELAQVSFCINAGGDVLVDASPDLPVSGAGAVTWRVGIEDPRDRSRIAATLSVTSGAVATSGTAARGAHLYDPVAGAMVGRGGSVTVIGPSLLWADIWATALFVGGPAAVRSFGVEAPGYRSLTL